MLTISAANGTKDDQTRSGGCVGDHASDTLVATMSTTVMPADDCTMMLSLKTTRLAL
jgi:hypothetical protein